jgi:dTMP kinase
VLIAIEGIDGAGKSTQARMLMNWQSRRTEPHAFLTKWNSSTLIKHAAKKAKKARILTPTTFALLEAADLADRYDRAIKPALEAGRIVVADRWVYTAFARGMGRHLDAAWLRGIYSFAPRPDVCFYLALRPQVALERIQKARFVKHYEAGMDVTAMKDPAVSFLEFQATAIAAYNGMQLAEQMYIVIDAEISAAEQHDIITEMILSRLSGAE